MTMREVTPEDMAKMLDVIKAAADWQAYREFALKYYGPNADVIKTATGEEYNDETYDDKVMYVTVIDHEGDEMQPDLTLPAWHPYIENHNRWVSENHNGYYTKYPEAREYDPESDMYDVISELPTLKNDETEFVFLVNTPPQLPKLFIEE